MCKKLKDLCQLPINGHSPQKHKSNKLAQITFIKPTIDQRYNEITATNVESYQVHQYVINRIFQLEFDITVCIYICMSYDDDRRTDAEIYNLTYAILYSDGIKQKEKVNIKHQYLSVSFNKFCAFVSIKF